MKFVKRFDRRVTYTPDMGSEVGREVRPLDQAGGRPNSGTPKSGRMRYFGIGAGIMLVLMALAVLLGSTTGCGGGKVEAAPPPPLVPSSLALNCPQTMNVTDEPGFLKLDWGECGYSTSGTEPISSDAAISYTLTQPIRALFIDSWIGTRADSTGIEVGVDLTITLPDGRVRYFVNEFDKHQDVVGEQWRQWQVPLTLPVGTVLKLHTVAGVTRPATDCPLHCGHESVWILEDGI